MLHNLLVKTASEIIAYKSMCLYGQKNDLVTHNEFLTSLFWILPVGSGKYHLIK
nr:hypothetical protein [uncultured Anaerobutyricum sp.]